MNDIASSCNMLQNHYNHYYTIGIGLYMAELLQPVARINVLFVRRNIDATPKHGLKIIQ
jgi:hypothetical protein